MNSTFWIGVYVCGGSAFLYWNPMNSPVVAQDTGGGLIAILAFFVGIGIMFYGLYEQKQDEIKELKKTHREQLDALEAERDSVKRRKLYYSFIHPENTEQSPDQYTSASKEATQTVQGDG